MELPSATGVAIVTVPAAVAGSRSPSCRSPCRPRPPRGSVVESGALIVMVSPIPSAPFALV